MKTWLSIQVLVLAVLGGAAPARAGYQTSVPVAVEGNSAYGAPGSARSSADTTQYIGCLLHNTGGSTTLVCSAKTSTGVSGACRSTAANLISMAGTITSDTFIAFSWDGGANCISLTLYNYSQYEPKK